MMNYHSDLSGLMEHIGAELVNQGSDSPINCTGLTEDSRKVKEGELFIARPGLDSDGRRYVHQAVAKGASAVLVEAQHLEQFVQTSETEVPVYKVKNLASLLGTLADKYYGSPSKELTIVGVTGTNGKTSCSQISGRILAQLGYSAAIMGTMGNGIVDQLDETSNTTMDAITVHRYLAQFRDDGVQFVIMEVSSHALVQGRVSKVRFDAAVLTNLSRDHLDYHGDMSSYAAAKKQLFLWPDLKSVIVNSDDSVGSDILSDNQVTAQKYSYSITAINAGADDHSVYTEAVDFKDEGIFADLRTPWGNADLKTSLIGQFNLSNCLAVVTLLGALGIELDNVIDGVARLKPVEGRMECFGGQNKPMAVVDYAHTPDALKHALRALRPHTNHRLWCVFGCGGDRDRGKRPQMAAIAEEYADYIVLTSDNPRSEDVTDIINEMRAGLQNPTACIVEPDRKLAIESVMNKSVIGDVVLLAGKGHEQYQHVGMEKLPHSDIEIVTNALEKGNWS